MRGLPPVLNACSRSGLVGSSYTSPVPAQNHTPDSLKDSSRGERLHKYLADIGVASRRACEAMIKQGRVRVNGRVVREMPVWVDPREDRIEVDGDVLSRPAREGERPGSGNANRAGAKGARHVYVMLNKPRHTVCTASDPDGRRTVLDLVNHPSGARLYPVGRLDYDTMGLLILTNDGELANKITHPRHGIHKTYRAVVKGSLSDADVAELERGIYLAERKEGKTTGAARTASVKIDIVGRETSRTVLDITLPEGRNRQVRRMLAKVGCPVKKLMRIRLGPLSLKGVSLGKWRELTMTEIGMLRSAAEGKKKIKGTARAEPAVRKKQPLYFDHAPPMDDADDGRAPSRDRRGAPASRERGPSRDRPRRENDRAGRPQPPARDQRPARPSPKPAPARGTAQPKFAASRPAPASPTPRPAHASPAPKPKRSGHPLLGPAKKGPPGPRPTRSTRPPRPPRSGSR